MIDRDPTTLTLDDWITELDASEAEVELVPGEVVLAELEQQLARLEARLQSSAVTEICRWNEKSRTIVPLFYEFLHEHQSSRSN